MKTPFFYFYSYEIYTSAGNLKSKGWGTCSRSHKISNPDDWNAFFETVRSELNIGQTDLIHWSAVSRLNS